ncbi:efflux RND transporter periplasmic adaptor subunit [Alkalimarinus coralli]|uniref:efflux RND transporter periplasmic adaptor subunit n=1 Tax=Alkalimarinus coralli TaxID=2935863 RepID=UPI00202B3112|nr:efflux RND transporter periplasmic adaptor subunit [Alkalimarinus coralli]
MKKRICNRSWIAPLVFACLTVTGCGDNSASSQPDKSAPLPSVVVTTVSSESINPSRRFIGRTEAVEDVQIKARVSGYLLSMNFAEGQDVKKGDLLFEIDPKPYQTEVSRLSAEVSRQQASLTNAKRNFRRGNELIEKGFISAMEMDDLISRRDQAKASLESSEAALETAKLNLSYTKIVAPISGRIGRKSLSIGDLVSPESGVLVTIVTVDPMYVTFDVSEKLLTSENQKNNPSSDKVKKLPIPSIELPNGDMYPHKGKFDFIDNRVDPATGTVKVRAVFPNEKGLLIPGQYVTAVVTASEAQNAILIPQAAVSEDQQGYFAMVVDDKNTVQVRRVEMGDRVEVSWVVDKGLSEGDKVIVEGLQKVKKGQQVNPVDQTVKAFDETNSK